MKQRSGFRNQVEAAVSWVMLQTLRRWSVGRFYARALDLSFPRLRRIADLNLRMAYPESDASWRKQTVDEVFASIGRLMFCFARLPEINRDNVDRWIRYEGFEHYARAKEQGKGVLFATAHLGNWELSAFAHALLTEPMSIVVRPLDNPQIDQLVAHHRSLSGNTLLSKRDFARSILHALKANAPVGVLVDQNASTENGAFVDFFGQPACTNLTFARLAARSGAAVLPGFAVWNEAESRYILRFYPPVQISGDAVEDTARVQAAIEHAIRQSPGQWLWIHRRWKTRPPGEPNLYAGL